MKSLFSLPQCFSLQEAYIWLIFHVTFFASLQYAIIDAGITFTAKDRTLSILFPLNIMGFFKIIFYFPFCDSVSIK